MIRMHLRLPMVLLTGLLLLLVFFPSGERWLGSGVIGGCSIAALFALFVQISGPATIRALIRREPSLLAMFGLFLVLIWGSASMVAGKPLLTPLHTTHSLSGSWLSQLGTPLLLDIGILVVCAGAITQGVLLLTEQDTSEGLPGPPDRSDEVDHSSLRS